MLYSFYNITLAVNLIVLLWLLIFYSYKLYKKKFSTQNYSELVLNSISKGIIALDNNLNIIYANPLARSITFNTNNKAIIGNHLSSIFSGKAICNLVEKTINEDCSYSEELTTSGEYKILSLTTSTVKSKENIIGAVIFIQDITKIKNLERKDAEFVSNVSHELKTPLTSIRGFIETLRGGAINDHEVALKFLDIIDIEAERLFFLINDILALSEIETMGQSGLTKEVSLEDIVEDAVNILQGQADKKSISISYEIDKGLIMKASKHKIMQLVMNLVDNSIKYSSDGSWVRIRGYKTKDSIILSFKDSGIGIPEEHRERIFERFYRVDKGRSRSMGGTGLGLSIVRHIVDIYDGTITLNSEVEKGSEFVITFPINQRSASL